MILIRRALTWIHRTVRIPFVTVVDPIRKLPDLYFKVMDSKFQVANLKADVGELRSGGIPQFNPCVKIMPTVRANKLIMAVEKLQ